MGKIGLEARTEIDMPTPKSTYEGFRVLVIMRAELAGFAGVLGHMRKMKILLLSLNHDSQATKEY